MKTKAKEIDRLVSENNNLEEQLTKKKAENRNLAADENKSLVNEKNKSHASVLEKPMIEHDVKFTSITFLYDTFQEQRPIWVPWRSKFKVCSFGLAMTSFVWNSALPHLYT